MSIDHLSTVHDAMTKAAQEVKPPVLQAFTFRLDPKRVVEASELCERHGTTLAVFIRKTLDCLVEDYRGTPFKEES